MSKVDALRALREARYAATPARPATPVKASAAAPKTTVVPKALVTKVPVVEAAELGLCGHRSMNNRSCTRPSGHAEKNHRYS